MEEFVVLVTPQDEVIGQMEKLKAHEQGVLHRAFSVFLFDKQNRMLLQKRAHTKYHSPGEWTNACCSHPRVGETYEQAAKRRLIEELGIETPIEPKFHFLYKAEVGGNLIEHELDHVFTGLYEGEFDLNKDEVEQVRYLSLEQLDLELQEQPENFTPWFKIILNQYKEHLK